jgi:hypothetical protein
MIALRYAALLAGAITLGCLYFTPNANPASLALVGFFAICFLTVCFTCRGTKPRRRP